MKKAYYFLLVLILPLKGISQGTLRVQSGTYITSSNASFIVLDNTHFVNDGNITQSAGHGTLKFAGNANLILSGSGFTTLDQLTLGFTGSTRLNLQKNIAVVGGINFDGGLLNLNDAVIDLGTTGLLQSESENNRAYTTGTGYIQALAALNAPSSANPGNLGAVITSSTNLGSTTIRRGHQSQVNNYGNGNSILRYYDITPANNASLNATLRINYFDAELNGLNEPSLSMWRSADNTSWTNVGFDSRNATFNYVEKGSIASFSRWTLSTANNALPLFFGAVNAACISNAVKISWSTLQEQHVVRFEIEGADAQGNWLVVASVPAVGSGNNQYSFTDRLAGKRIMYRVIAYDADGRKTYTGILRSACTGSAAFSVYPNPVLSNVTISLYSPAPGPLKLNLYDAKGALVYRQQQQVSAGSTIISVPMVGLAKGAYLLSVSWNDMTETIRLVKE
ncbi:MAG TPA: T9SS type A sorting domain-containing protein [Chitinophagaceae bacterium]|nr:T9SS type A sorting domain-containing protein [Chitinophagaceae bacterium]